MAMGQPCMSSRTLGAIIVQLAQKSTCLPSATSLRRHAMLIVEVDGQIVVRRVRATRDPIARAGHGLGVDPPVFLPQSMERDRILRWRKVEPAQISGLFPEPRSVPARKPAVGPVGFNLVVGEDVRSGKPKSRYL